LKKLSQLLAKTAKSLELFEHTRISIAWQDVDLVYRHAHNPSPDLGMDIVGKRLEDIIGDTEQARRLSAIKRTVLETGESYQERVEIPIGQRPHHYDLTIEPTYDANGAMDGLVSINIEITDLIEAKKQLAEANERLLRLLNETLDTQPRPPLRRRHS